MALRYVLCRYDQEWPGQGVYIAVRANLKLGHSLQQGSLRSRACPVDLIGNQDVGEHRAGPELEVALLHVEDRRARDVAWQQVGRALDARKRPLDGIGQGLGH